MLKSDYIYSIHPSEVIVCPDSLVVEHQSCKLEVASSILASGFFATASFYSEIIFFTLTQSEGEEVGFRGNIFE
jgi:hypothetical protein